MGKGGRTKEINFHYKSCYLGETFQWPPQGKRYEANLQGYMLALKLENH